MNEVRTVICMKGKTKILIGLSLSGILACSLWVPSQLLYADEQSGNEEKLEGMSYEDQTGLFLSMDEQGNVSYVKPQITDMEDELKAANADDATYELKMKRGDESFTLGEYDTFKEANDAMTRRVLYRSIGDVEVYSNGQLLSNTGYSVVNFNTKEDTTNYREVGTGTSGYTYGGYAADAAYLGTDSNGKVKFRMAGVTGLVDKKDVQIVAFNDNLTLSHYKVSNGNLYHYVSTGIYNDSTASTQLMGTAPSYLSANTKYYSYDGHYFYTNYGNMIEDYKAGVSNRAVNANQPFYNYYQFLSHRTKTTFTAADFNKRVNDALGGKTSKMTNSGQYFIDNQNQYSANASLMYGVAINESAWGQSKIANDKNNLFGHGAVDSNPYYGANGYKNVSDSIKYHAEVYVDKGYLNPADWRYFGPHLGDKASGMNVKYASDPYWGEKAAAQSYYLEISSGKDDSSKYTIGIAATNSPINIRKDASTSSTAIYTTGNGSRNVGVTGFPFVIVGEVQGESVNGNTKWYKIQTDGSLKSDRTNLDINRNYDFSHDYGYVNASLINVVQKGNNSITDNTPAPSPEPTPSYTLGDVNGDGKITPADYVKVKNHIMGKSKLTGNSLKAADMNGDGKITPADYVKIKNHIMGK